MFYPFSYFRFDPTMIILIPAVILTIYAQSKVQSNFAKYLRVPTQKGYTGVQVVFGKLKIQVLAMKNAIISTT